MRFAGGLKVQQKEKVFCVHCARRGVKCEQRFDKAAQGRKSILASNLHVAGGRG